MGYISVLQQVMMDDKHERISIGAYFIYALRWDDKIHFSLVFLEKEIDVGKWNHEQQSCSAAALDGLVCIQYPFPFLQVRPHTLS